MAEKPIKMARFLRLSEKTATGKTKLHQPRCSTVAIGGKVRRTHGEREDGGENVGRSRQTQRELAVVSSTGEDDGKEVREGVTVTCSSIRQLNQTQPEKSVRDLRRHGREAENETECPELKVRRVLETLHDGKLVGFGISTITVYSGDDEVALFGLEERRAVGEVDDGEGGDQSEADGDDAENEEDPAPPGEAVFLVEKRDGVAEDVGEAGNDHRRQVEERHSLLKFVAGVPAGDEEHAAREEP